MANKRITIDTDFIVAEEKILNIVVGILFLGIFIYGLTDAINKGFSKLSYVSYIFFLLLIPAILAFKKARSKAVYLRINKIGIYQNEELLTTWDKFIKAYITQKEVVMTIRDNFLLVVEYVKDDPKKGYRRKIALTNTQNKSEEDIMAAIQFFFREYKEGFHFV
jgi:hypothetical protein